MFLEATFYPKAHNLQQMHNETKQQKWCDNWCYTVTESRRAVRPLAFRAGTAENLILKDSDEIQKFNWPSRVELKIFSSWNYFFMQSFLKNFELSYFLSF